MSPAEILVLVGAACFGAVVGSFLNVVVYRLPRPDLRVGRPRRSQCTSCGATIAWHDNVPLISWLLLRGRCRACGAGISVRYPLVEALTAGLFLLLAYRLVVSPGRVGELQSWLLLFASATFVAALVAATFIDIDHTIIPDAITKPGMVAAPVISLLVPGLHQPYVTDWLPELSPNVASFLLSLAGVAAGAGTIWLLGFLGGLLFRRRAREHGGAMGFGDVKFMGLVGGFLGPLGVILAILLGCVFGTVVGIPRLLFSKEHWIPFGPFLSLGAFAMHLFPREILHVLTEDYPRLMQSLWP